MKFTKIGSRGEVVIPKRLRDLSGIKEGDDVLLKMTGDVITIEKVEQGVGSMVTLLKRGSPFTKDLTETLRNHWD